MRRGEDEPIGPDTGGGRDPLCGEPMEERRDRAEVGYGESDTFTPCVLENQRPDVQSESVAPRFLALGSVAEQSDAGGRRDVGAAEARAKAGSGSVRRGRDRCGKGTRLVTVTAAGDQR